ncbi:hypothetical protein [Geobacillus phage TP-84]|uniref:DUF3310 domain-containing protein n=1 Tax=Geobacillus phage TP-84 TaxID=1965361 RepID=A0A1U9WQP3_9CAUD|nr:hypothetical protein MUK65_gp03 [Geobacillus phage TP-84]AQY55101.1 hypothetical protein [Geobacillus phage TP-84]
MVKTEQKQMSSVQNIRCFTIKMSADRIGQHPKIPNNHHFIHSKGESFMGLKMWIKKKLGLVYPSDVLRDKPGGFIDTTAFGTMPVNQIKPKQGGSNMADTYAEAMINKTNYPDADPEMTFEVQRSTLDKLAEEYKKTMDKVDKNENVHDVHQDVINKPRHYHQGGFDALYVIERKFGRVVLRGFYIGNIIKYILRFEQKNGVEDLKKARFYLDKLIELEEGSAPDQRG